MTISMLHRIRIQLLLGGTAGAIEKLSLATAAFVALAATTALVAILLPAHGRPRPITLMRRWEGKASKGTTLATGIGPTSLGVPL